MKSVIAIVGPTASGKTKLSIDFAKMVHGEIISADSMQVYKYMDIGTAKPDADEMRGIRHYLINELDPDEEFNVVRFKELAVDYIEEILGRNKVPIITGGTGLYINSLVYNISFSETISDWDLREKLKKEAEEKGNKFLHDKLKMVDPFAADKIHENNVKRVIRALEVYEHSRKTISEHQEISRLEPSPYHYILIGLKVNREKLYERINKRVDLMLERGLVQEVKKLVDMGFDKYTVAMQGIGYKEILSCLKGEISLDEAIYIIKRDTRHYAKRQETWFKRLENVHWIDTDEHRDESEMLEKVYNYVASSGIFL